MCKFFSFISDGQGTFKFLTEEHRNLALDGKLNDPSGNSISIEQVDSHAAIASFFKVKEDKHNKYEYDPDKDVFTIDQLNTEDDSKLAKVWVESLSYRMLAKLKNSGNRNSGNSNSGYRNSGNYNSGNRNSGYRNSGNYNSDNYNSGHCNSGDYNSGHCNSGDYNSGYRNSGNYNSGNYNSGNSNSGLFNTNEPNVRIFNRNSKISRKDPRIQSILYKGPNVTEWVDFSIMNDQEKKYNPSAKTTGGYIKKLDYKTSWKGYWGNLKQDDKDCFLNLPFFDCSIFEEITGVDVKEEFISFKNRKKVV